MAAPGEDTFLVEIPEESLQPLEALPYACNFCPRRFGQAQALGGHMSVHRR